MLGKVVNNGILIMLHIEKEADKKTKSGIIIPQGIDEEFQKKMKFFKEHPLQGDVIQVGDQVKICGAGDRVYLNSSGIDIIEDGVYYSLIKDYDVLYVIDSDIWKKKLELDEEKSKINVVMD